MRASARGKKRKPDLRRIRPTKTYTVPEISKTLGRDVATVRRWVSAGLPTLDDRRPTLVRGEDLGNWLREYRAARKHKCAPNQIFCLKCRVPRLPSPNTVTIDEQNEKTLMVRARCSVCRKQLNRVASRARRTETEAAFRKFMVAGAADEM